MQTQAPGPDAGQLLQAGDTLLGGRYRIDALIGRGAFGEVYRATHVALDATRALKILRHDAPGVGSSDFEAGRRRFQLEAESSEPAIHYIARAAA